ncbi:efflux RND transporter periplasmic adaptor subunit [Oleisolibacter albus]|uniref:efflux RND transporter periplasmic adaptor subunit n=1 Tax=Oleisolibacter albus TaxID=2171757 RepID=UPI000DF4A942|nr:efflux RND transporter periplasmic adaptor subunit [Oleisolibacter albus]
MQRSVWVVLVLSAVVAAGAWYGFGRRSGGEGRAAAPPPEVTVATVSRGPAALSVAAVGTVRPIQSVQIMPLVEGPIIRVAFTDGQLVQPGQLLFEIDPRPYQAALDQAEGQQAQDRANLTSARLDLARAEELAEKRFTSRQSLDQQRATVEALTAAVKADEARVAAARVNLERTRITAPVAGKVGQAQLTVGNIARPGQTTPLTTINQLSPIDVQFALPQARLPQMHTANGQGPVPVIARDSQTGRTLAQGALVFIDNTVDAATGTVSMKARFANEDGVLWPGQFLTMAAQIDQRPDAVLLDPAAVATGPDGYYVYVVRPDDTVEARAVTLADLQDARAVVDAGLSGGERVIVNGQLRVVPGGKVRVRQTAPAPDQMPGPAQASALPQGAPAR